MIKIFINLKKTKINFKLLDLKHKIKKKILIKQKGKNLCKII